MFGAARAPLRIRLRAVTLALRWRLLGMERRWALAPAPVALGRAIGGLGLIALPVWLAYDLFLPAGPYDGPLFALAAALTIALLRAPARWLNRFTMGFLVVGATAMQAIAAASSGRADRLSAAWFLAIVVIVSVFVTPRAAIVVALVCTAGLAAGLVAQGALDSGVQASLVASGTLAMLIGVSVSTLSSRQRRSLRRMERRLGRVRRAVAVRREEAYTDPLTGLASRRRFDVDLAAALADRRAGGRVVLVLADLDGLKTINDALGHPSGDEALRAVADALRHALRGSDAVYRIGGDEFAAILEATEAAGVRARLGDFVTAEVPGDGAGWAGLRALRVSLGIASARPSDTPADLVARADKALYRVKKALPSTRPDPSGSPPAGSPPATRAS
jgi:diguanylate cyclase (GGDEF)-like protein